MAADKFVPLTPHELALLSKGLQGRSDGLKGEQKFVDDSDWTTERAERLLEEIARRRLDDKGVGSFGALGNKVTEYSGLETFPVAVGLASVLMSSDEVTSLCPVTGQPDWYTIEVEYHPALKCIESKTFKLYVNTFRNRGLFCEALAAEVVREIVKYADPMYVLVRVTQKPRGGVTIKALAEWPIKDKTSNPPQGDQR